MPDKKTEATELAVGFGILGQDPLNIDLDKIEELFCGTLNLDKFQNFQQEYSSNYKLIPTYHLLYNLGLKIRDYLISKNITPQIIEWTGPQRQYASVTLSKDLIIPNSLPISVKTESNVVYNLSPFNLFVQLPQALGFQKTRKQNWFLINAAKEYQNMYNVIATEIPNLPTNVFDFENTVTRKERKKIAKFLEDLKQSNPNKHSQFVNAYQAMCHKVAYVSAEQFNQLFSNTWQKNRVNLIAHIMRVFFRINSVSYILVCIEKKQPSALIIPDITNWSKRWELVKVKATPELRGQSIVSFEVTIRNRTTKQDFNFPFHAEIRWSHGKFCGSPEAKLYKDFSWSTVPFFQKI